MQNETKLVRFDWAMQTLLRNEANFEILEGFLNTVIDEEVKVVRVLENKPNQPYINQKINQIDILVTDQQQRYIIIEVQNHYSTACLERALFGVSKVIVDTIAQVEKCYEVSKVISIGILHFNLGLDGDYIYHGTTDFLGVHNQKSPKFRRRFNNQQNLQKLSAKDIFPEYYLINLEGFADEIKTDLDEWMYLLKHSALCPNFNAKGLELACEVLSPKLAMLNMSVEERHYYEHYMLDVASEQNVIESAINKGRQEGLKQGKLAIAKKMLETGLNVETVACITGLTLDMM